MSFPNRSFDTVCSALFLEHVSDVEGSLREMSRVLKKGGTLIIDMPNFLDPVQHLSYFIRWKKKPHYRPWEPVTRAGAIYQFVRTLFIKISKFVRLNRKIYSLNPVLTEDDETCGNDFDATWLANAYDVKNLLSDMGMSVEVFFPKNIDHGQVVGIMERIGLPVSWQRAYEETRSSGFTVVAKKL